MLKPQISCCAYWTALVLTTFVVVEEAWPESNSQQRTTSRRIIYNDDGGKMKNMTHSSIESYLSSRLARLEDTQVDSVFFCGHDDWAGAFYESEVDGVELRASSALRQLLCEGIDPMQETIDFCHQNNIDIFYSFRMNDIHDSFSGNIGQLKQDHPEWLLGNKDRDHPPVDTSNRTLKECIWSSLNYDLPPVREHIMRFIREAIERWEWDGLELDYGRNASLFPAVFEGRSATDEDRKTLTIFQRQIRERANAAALNRRRPCLIAVVVPETIEKARHVGIDIERWLEEDLVDIIIAGNGYIPFSPAAFEMISVGRRHGVPVHIKVNANTGGSGHPYHNYIELWRACATNAIESGSDGIYLFNTYDSKRYYNHKLELFNELDSSDALRFRDKLYLVDWDFTQWGYGGGDVEFYMPRNNLLPLHLADKENQVEFTCFENIRRAISLGKKPDIILRLGVEGLKAGDEVTFVINEFLLLEPSSEIESDGIVTYEYVLEPEQISCGTNTIRANLVQREVEATQAAMTVAELWMRYSE